MHRCPIAIFAVSTQGLQKDNERRATSGKDGEPLLGHCVGDLRSPYERQDAARHGKNRLRELKEQEIPEPKVIGGKPLQFQILVDLHLQALASEMIERDTVLAIAFLQAV